MSDVIRAANITKADRELLAAVSDKLRSLFWNSRWQQCEAEEIARQTVGACKLNLEAKGEPLSWLGHGATRGRAMCGTDNAKGLQLVIDSGHLVVEDGPEGMSPDDPSDIATKDGMYQCLRLTRNMLDLVRAEAK